MKYKSYLVFFKDQETGERCSKIRFREKGIWAKSEESDKEATYWYFYPYSTIESIMKIYKNKEDY